MEPFIDNNESSWLLLCDGLMSSWKSSYTKEKPLNLSDLVQKFPHYLSIV